VPGLLLELLRSIALVAPSAKRPHLYLDMQLRAGFIPSG